MKLRNKFTGEIKKAEAREDGIYLWNKEIGKWYKYSLDLLASAWEYYIEPKEPLIEGRSQRAILRAAAEISGTTTATVKRCKIAGIVVFDYGGQCRVELKDRGINIESSGVYTVQELCGEEE